MVLPHRISYWTTPPLDSATTWVHYRAQYHSPRSVLLVRFTTYAPTYTGFWMDPAFTAHHGYVGPTSGLYTYHRVRMPHHVPHTCAALLCHTFTHSSAVLLDCLHRSLGDFYLPTVFAVHHVPAVTSCHSLQFWFTTFGSWTGLPFSRFTFGSTGFTPTFTDSSFSFHWITPRTYVRHTFLDSHTCPHTQFTHTHTPTTAVWTYHTPLYVWIGLRIFTFVMQVPGFCGCLVTVWFTVGFYTPVHYLVHTFYVPFTVRFTPTFGYVWLFGWLLGWFTVLPVCVAVCGFPRFTTTTGLHGLLHTHHYGLRSRSRWFTAFTNCTLPTTFTHGSHVHRYTCLGSLHSLSHTVHYVHSSVRLVPSRTRSHTCSFAAATGSQDGFTHTHVHTPHCTLSLLTRSYYTTISYYTRCTHTCLPPAHRFYIPPAHSPFTPHHVSLVGSHRLVGLDPGFP